MLNRILNRFDNAVLTSAELRFWETRQHVTRSKRWFWLQRSFTTVVAILSVLLFIYELIAVAYNLDLWQAISIQLPRRSIAPMLLAIVPILIVTAFAAPFGRARMLARQLIARDKSRRDAWELIVLTGVDARSYVRAKWWTTVRLIAPQLLPSVLIRAGMTAFFVGELTRFIANNTIALNFGDGYYTAPSPFDILLVGVLSVVLTYAGLPITVAGSIDDMLDFPRHGTTWAMWALRSFVSILEFVVLTLSLLAIMGVLTVTTQNFAVLLVVGMVLWTVLDNGFILCAMLAMYMFSFSPVSQHYLLSTPQALLVVLLALPLMLARTWFRLKMAERTARRHQLVTAKASENAE